MTKQAFFFSIDKSRVDLRNGVIYGVSLISKGEAKGHEMFVDDTTLDQVLQYALQSGSIKVKADHGSGVFSTIGFVNNFAKEDGKVIGDFHVYDSEPEKDRIFEIASKNPNHMGISIEFEGEPQTIGVKKFARCEELMTAALVSDPAANKSLFEKKMGNNTNLNNKEDTTMKNKYEAGTNESGTDPLVAFGTKLDEIMARLSKLEEGPATDSNEEDENGEAPKAINPNTAPATKDDELKGEEFADQENTDAQKGKIESDKKEVAEMAAKKAVEHLASKIGVKFSRPSVHTNLGGEIKDAKDKTFAQLLEEKTDELDGDHVSAMLFCLKKHKKQYAFWRPVKPDTNKLAR